MPGRKLLVPTHAASRDPAEVHQKADVAPAAFLPVAPRTGSDTVIRRTIWFSPKDPIDVDSEADEGYSLDGATAQRVNDVLADKAFSGAGTVRLGLYRDALDAYAGEDRHLSFNSAQALRDWLDREIPQASPSTDSSDESDTESAPSNRSGSSRRGPKAKHGKTVKKAMMTVGSQKLNADELHLQVKADVKAKLGTRGIEKLLKRKGAKNFDMRIEKDGTIRIGENETGGKNGVDSGLVYDAKTGTVTARQSDESSEDPGTD
jgi:hypothetical protein